MVYDGLVGSGTVFRRTALRDTNNVKAKEV